MLVEGNSFFSKSFLQDFIRVYIIKEVTSKYISWRLTRRRIHSVTPDQPGEKDGEEDDEEEDDS